MKRSVVVLALSALAFVAMCYMAVRAFWRPGLPRRAEQILARPAELSLLSLDPGRGRARPGEDQFHGWRLLGKTSVTDARQQAALVAAVERGISHVNARSLCFEPRHGLEARSPAGAVDLVICYHCDVIQVYVDGQKVDELLTRDSGQAFLDGMLGAAHIPLGHYIGERAGAAQ